MTNKTQTEKTAQGDEMEEIITEEKEQSIFTTLRIKRIVMDELRIYKANGLFITYDDALEFLLKKENINERRKNEI